MSRVFIVGNVDVLHAAINGENVTKRFIERYLPLLLWIYLSRWTDSVDGIARKNSWLHHSFRATRHTCYKILRKHLSPVMVFPMLDGVFVQK